MNETICRGMKDFVYVSLGKTAYRNNPEYLELKKNFSSPGEVIERMEQYGYSSMEDYISAMEVVLWMEEAFSAEQIEMLFEGTQLEDFVKKVKEKAGDNLYLLYEIYLYEKSSRKKILEAINKTSLETIVGFLDWMTSNRLFGAADYLLAKDIVVSIEGKLKALNKKDVVEDADLFIHLIKFAYRLVWYTGEDNFKSDAVYKRLGLTKLLIALKDLYSGPLGNSSQKVLDLMGFSEMDILNLNCGIWLIKDQISYSSNTDTKWWRLKKRWFQSLFVQKNEITIRPVLEKMMVMTMPRRIDGEDFAREFYLEGFSEEIPNVQNSYLLFDFWTRRVNESEYLSFNSVDKVQKWKYICENHKLSVMDKEDVQWLKGLMIYLNPKGISFDGKVSVGADRNQRIFAEVINDCANLEEKQELLTDIFQKDVKEFIYQFSEFFSVEFLNPLFISGFLKLDEYYKENSNAAAEYLRDMEYPFQLTFLTKFCEDKDWLFSFKEATFLKVAVTESWVIRMAYPNKSTDIYFKYFSMEEKKLLLELMCKLCVRIPSICRDDLLMAGFITNVETRFILGEEIAQEWYRVLKERGYMYLDSLERDFFSEDAYKKILKKQKEQKEKEEQSKEAIEVEEEKTTLEKKLLSFHVKEALEVFADAVPASVSSQRKQTLVLLEVYKEQFEDKRIFADRKIICKLMKFFLDCYENNYISKQVLKNKLNFLEEE